MRCLSAFLLALFISATTSDADPQLAQQLRRLERRQSVVVDAEPGEGVH